MATSYQTDNDGPAIPTDNILEIRARDSEVNEDNGIRTSNDPDGGRIVYCELTNRLQGKVKTEVGTLTLNIVDLVLDLGDVECITFDFTISAASLFAGSGNWGSKHLKFFAGVLVDPVLGSGSVTGSSSSVQFETGGTEDMSGCTADIIVAGNAALLTVTGIAQDVYWNVVGYYTTMTNSTAEV